jgi:hypothetical protein
MATDPSVVEASRDGAPALHEREFSITSKGYDREEVRAYWLRSKRICVSWRTGHDEPRHVSLSLRRKATQSMMWIRR